MQLYTYKCEEEECQGNIYEIIFRSHIGIPILVADNNQWIQVKDWEIASQESKRLLSFCKGNSYFYAGSDVLVRVNEITLICAILAAPFEKHTVHLSFGVDWHDWKQIQHVYHLASLIHDSQNPFPDFDASNPAASIFNPTPYQTRLSGYNSKTIKRVTSKWGTFFGDGSLETRPTYEMQLRQHFSSQLRKQILYPTNGVLKCTGGISRYIRSSQNRISQVIQEDLLSTGSCYIPYIGTLSLKDGTLRFSASRMLRDRIHNRTSQNVKRQNIRDYGGEKQPSQSALLWTHRNISQLSRRRQFVLKMKSIGTSNIVYQAFVDSLYFHLCHGKRVTISGIGTLRTNQSKRISFRTSNKFRRMYKEHVAQSQIGDGNVG